MIKSILSSAFCRVGLCFIAGALSGLSMAPWFLLPLLFVGFSVLYTIINASTNTFGSGLCGWFFGFGYFLVSLYWVANALLVEGNDYAWAYPIAVTGLPALLAFFPAFGAAFSKRFFNFKMLSGFFGFCAVMALSEWLRGHVLSGFPWNLYGYSWGNILPMLQILSIGNVYFLTALTIFWASIGGFIFIHKAIFRPATPMIIAAITTIAATYIYGSNRLDDAQNLGNQNVIAKVIQPNIAQHEKWDREKIPDNFRKILRLSAATGEENAPVILVWPETAIAQMHLNDTGAMNAIKDMLASYPQGANLLTGTLRHNLATNGFYNSLVMLSTNGQIENIYDKHHLVPFGEYIPLQNIIPLRTINRFSGFTAGNDNKTQETDFGQSYSPLVCYEILFPGGVTANDNHPDFIANVTNDAWYGDKVGPHQHLLKARFRAIEEGIPVLRSANTGISAIIDPYGQVLATKNMFEDGFIQVLLPNKKNNFGVGAFLQNAIFLTLSIGLTILALYRNRTLYKY